MPLTAQSRDQFTNGINVTKLGEVIGAIQANSELAQFKFRAQNDWHWGTQNEARISDFFGTSREVVHREPFSLGMDEPAVLLGADSAPNPVEVLLAALSGCMTSTLAYKAAAQGLPLDDVFSEFEGDIDLQGFLGLNPSSPIGYREIRVKFKVKGDGDEDTLRAQLQTSPVYNSLVNPVKVIVEVEKL